jgi:hypothetical protein
MKYAETRPYADPEKAARKLLEIANSVELLTLDNPLIAKPSTRIEGLGDAIRFLATPLRKCARSLIGIAPFIRLARLLTSRDISMWPL